MTDWNALRAEYLSSKISVRALAAKYGVSPHTLQRRAAIEQWTTLRVQFREKLVAETIRKTARKAAVKEADHLSRLMQATARTIDVALKAASDDKQFNRYLVTDGAAEGEMQERIFEKIDTRALKDLTAVLKNLTALQREFYDLPTPAEERAQTLAAQRLELERKKCADTDESETGVVVLPPVAAAAADQ